MALHFVVADLPAGAETHEVVLTGAEAHHAAAVRRVRIGEDVTGGDGCGVWLQGTVSAVAAKEVVVTLDPERARVIEEPRPRVALVQALAKGDRDELAVQTATELGVDDVMPWQAARSISRWDAAKASKGVARWESIAREAAKQAHRAWLPTVTPPVTTSQLAELAATTRMLVLDPTAREKLSDVVFVAAEATPILLVVGPEGGITPDELASLAEAGARRVRLGDTVLRTSTAGPAALTVVNLALGRW